MSCMHICLGVCLACWSSDMILGLPMPIAAMKHGQGIFAKGSMPIDMLSVLSGMRHSPFPGLQWSNSTM